MYVLILFALPELRKLSQYSACRALGKASFWVSL